MAEYKAYLCDRCAKVIEEEERTKITTRLEGPNHDDQYVEDVCSGCLAIPEGATLTAVRRRGSAPEPAPAPVQSSGPMRPSAGE